MYVVRGVGSGDDIDGDVNAGVRRIFSRGVVIGVDGDVGG